VKTENHIPIRENLYDRNLVPSKRPPRGRTEILDKQIQFVRRKAAVPRDPAYFPQVAVEIWGDFFFGVS
jgi:hypothetical protein